MCRKKLQLAQAALGKADPILKKIIRRYGVCTLKPHRDYFHTLVCSIISQQISVKAAESIERKLLSTIGGSFDPKRLARLTTARFRQAGVSPQKMGYLKDLSRRWITGEVEHSRFARLSDEEVIAELVKVKGIGRWTAEMFLIFSLCRLDVLPVADLGFQRAVKLAYGIKKMPAERALKRLGESWRPYRSVATWYLWRSLENGQMKG